MYHKQLIGLQTKQDDRGIVGRKSGVRLLTLFCDMILEAKASAICMEKAASVRVGKGPQ